MLRDKDSFPEQSIARKPHLHMHKKSNTAYFAVDLSYSRKI